MIRLALFLCLLAGTASAQSWQVVMIRTAQNGNVTTNAFSINTARTAKLTAATGLTVPQFIRGAVKSVVDDYDVAQIERQARLEREAADAARAAQIEAIRQSAEE